MHLFGRELFQKRVETLYDFAQHGILNGTSSMVVNDYVSFEPVVTYTGQTLTNTNISATDKPKKKTAPKIELTPKALYELKTLNIPEFSINCDLEYLSENIVLLREKLGLIPKPLKPKKPKYEPVAIESEQVTYGRKELESMVERLSNRFRFDEFKDGFAEWPYTTTEAIAKMLKAHPHLRADNVKPMVPDLPKEAIEQIKKYTELTKKLCSKSPVFYLITEIKAQNDVAKRRDPILLAQSPFGFFWNIVGAWLDEVVFLEEL